MLEKIQGMLAEALNISADKVTPDAKIVEDLGADSLDVVEFVMEVEKEFDITIPDDAAAKLEKVGDAVKYIDEHKKN